MSPAHNAEGGRATAPMGWTAFCRRYADECRRDMFAVEPVVFEGPVKELLLRVNAAVNGAITPATDLLQWGAEERWDFAESGVGDCEDYALLKQRWLVSAGVPRAALLLTVVTDLAGEGHAVLTVHTDRGDYILDNMTDEVKLWRETPYGFVKRQSRSVSNQWVSLNGHDPAPAMASR
jgi:predicted transglutaminase-like cysteine proteinase